RPPGQVPTFAASVPSLGPVPVPRTELHLSSNSRARDWRRRASGSGGNAMARFGLHVLLHSLAIAAAALVAAGEFAATASADDARRGAEVALAPGPPGPRSPGARGVPPLPIDAHVDGQYDLRTYHYGKVKPDQVTDEALSHYDTVVLYGLRYATLPQTA